MTQPPVIASGQAHTVTLAPGSQTASHRQPRVSAPLQEAPALKYPASIRPESPPSRPPRAKAAAAAPTAQAPAEQAPMLGPHILQRISSLRERNGGVRAELDRLPAATPVR